MNRLCGWVRWCDFDMCSHNSLFGSLLYLGTILSGFEINNFAGQSAQSVCYNAI